MLSVFVHTFVVLLIIATGDIVHPLLVVEVPTDGLLDTFLELEAGLPPQLLLQLGGVDSIAHVVTKTVGDVGNEFQ